MAHLGATLQRVEPGHVVIVARRRDELTQQHGGRLSGHRRGVRRPDARQRR
jgi:hypothetical protein